MKKLLENTNSEVDPETLATFRIGLNDEEKKARDKLVLPYLPKYVTLLSYILYIKHKSK